MSQIFCNHLHSFYGYNLSTGAGELPGCAPVWSVLDCGVIVWPTHSLRDSHSSITVNLPSIFCWLPWLLRRSRGGWGGAHSVFIWVFVGCLFCHTLVYWPEWVIYQVMCQRLELQEIAIMNWKIQKKILNSTISNTLTKKKFHNKELNKNHKHLF